jgi:hypothetical protein
VVRHRLKTRFVTCYPRCSTTALAVEQHEPHLADVEDEVAEMVALLPLDEFSPSQVAQPGAQSAQLAARSPLVQIPPLQHLPMPAAEVQSGMTTEWQHASAVCKGAPYPLVWGDKVRTWPASDGPPVLRWHDTWRCRGI